MKEIHKDLLYAISTVGDGNMSCNYGGADSVVRNRKEFLGKLGLNLSDCVMMDLSHGDSVNIVGVADKGRAMGDCGTGGVQGDAMVTDKVGVYLFVLTADCLPLTLYDPQRKALALVHLSRINTNLKLTQKVVSLMREKWGSNPEDILVWGGPSISKTSYKLDFFKEEARGWDPFAVKMPNGKISVDVAGFNRQQLLDMGVKENNIDISEIDTFSSATYFSHYRTGRAGEPESRFATVVGIKDSQLHIDE
ncbi:MAG: polyphenol oxidase family protein [bacterium]|nr:polyphenol oxidase family protein [bacterium]MDZ4231300.1 polyphenol oxidase family protein [Patescibacteria group bacterium]